MFNKNDKALIWLEIVNSITYKRKKELLGLFQSPCALFNQFFEKSDLIKKLLDIDCYNNLKLAHDEAIIDTFIKDVESSNVKMITYYSDEYPDSLKQMINPPFVLYYKGRIELLKTFCFCIIGTRHCTHYGLEVCTKFTKSLCKNNFTIVSGLTAGIDTRAHTSALDVKGDTIAIVAGGLNNVYPTENSNLFNLISEKGLIISEYQPKVEYLSYNFPQRNRIFAGLCNGILIVEAGSKSGTMITKAYAESENKDVFCVPANINSLASQGTNQLIKNQEAITVLEPNDILKEFNVIPLKIIDKNMDIKLEYLEQGIIELVKHEPISFDEIQKKLQVNAKNLLSTLTKLEIKGLIKKLAGNIYTFNFKE